MGERRIGGEDLFLIALQIFEALAAVLIEFGGTKVLCAASASERAAPSSESLALRSSIPITPSA